MNKLFFFFFFQKQGTLSYFHHLGQSHGVSHLQKWLRLSGGARETLGLTYRHSREEVVQILDALLLLCICRFVFN